VPPRPAPGQACAPTTAPATTAAATAMTLTLRPPERGDQLSPSGGWVLNPGTGAKTQTRKEVGVVRAEEDAYSFVGAEESGGVESGFGGAGAEDGVGGLPGHDLECEAGAELAA